MIRRPAAGLLAALGLTLTGCGGFENNDDAAVVGETSISRQSYEALLSAFAAVPDLTELVEDPATASVPGDEGRRWLTYLVLGAVGEQFLAQAGEEVTDADRDAALEGFGENEDFDSLPDDVRQLVIDREASGSALARVPAPDRDELERRYAESPGSLGAVCARHIVVATEAEALAVLAELDAGADFAELAAERSLSPTAAQDGGVLSDGSGECIPASSLAGAGPEFLAVVADAEVGVPAGPAETSNGWHVIVLRPWDEIGGSVVALFEEQAGELLYTGFLSGVEIRVDPRYGRWDPPSNSVVALR